MNFKTEFEKGQQGLQKGIPLGPGLNNVSKAINGLQKGKIYVVAAGPKVGKSTIVDYAFVIEPCLQAIAGKIKLSIIYLSLEIDRVSKEFDFVTHFLYRDYDMTDYTLPEGVTVKGKSSIPLSPDLLRGRMQDDNENTILMSSDVKSKIDAIYTKYIIPIFGEYSSEGKRLQKGLITFIEERENPTGIYKKIKKFAGNRGKYSTQTIPSKKAGEPDRERIIGYTPNNTEEINLVVTDHIRKLVPERGWQMKQTIDKYSEYCVELRNLLGYSFVHIVHLNRSMANVERLKFSDSHIYPTSEDIKDSGNLSEDANYVFTMFNPNDHKYNLTTHFGKQIRTEEGEELNPNLRTLHLVESRHCFYPQHFSVEMQGNIKNFKQLKKEI